jgi:hypothetical protein
VLGILQRTCAVTIDPEIPGPVFRRMVDKLGDAVADFDRAASHVGSTEGSPARAVS